METVTHFVRQLSAREESRRFVDSHQFDRQISEGAIIERKTEYGSVISVDFSPDEISESVMRKTRILEALKEEVRLIMEESMRQQYIHLSSRFVVALCARVEQCLLDGLRRRLLGLFGRRSTLALLHNISRFCEDAATIFNMLPPAESTNGTFPQNLVWIRIALKERKLPAIIDHIHTSPQCRRYYEKDALMMDAVKGGVIAALLVGPCAIDYTSMKHVDSWSDPSADELLQRHLIHSMANSTSPKCLHRPPLSLLKHGSSVVSSVDSCSSSGCTYARDYVYSLHQNVKSSLLYGKNNVTVTLPPDGPPLKGYLSLHQNGTGNLTVKWTPNQLMHCGSQPTSASSDSSGCDNSWLWGHVINVNMNDIKYIHIHQLDEQSPATLVFVGCDGVQHSPIEFPIGSHMLSFLSCLESGLLPYNRIDPPLWVSESKGKMLPRLRRRTSLCATDSTAAVSTDDCVLHDFVFRLVPIFMPSANVVDSTNCENISINNNVFCNDHTSDGTTNAEINSPLPIKRSVSPCRRPTGSDSAIEKAIKQNLNTACTSMRAQILSRAFHGWLAYCRHLRTIRIHLAGLIVSNKEELRNTDGPVDEKYWNECRNDPSAESSFIRRVYWNGIVDDSTLRRQIWPYLLGVAEWTQTVDESALKRRYTQDVEEWKRIEKFVRIRDHAAFTAARVLHSSNNDDIGLPMRELSINSEVFEEAEESKVEDANLKCHEESLIISFGANLHRIEKDVNRCDRNYPYFVEAGNLEKLRSIMCTYVWRNLESGYVQGMCDLVAPLLVTLESEPLVLECFDCLMQRMRLNFPQGSGMDDNLASMRSLIQVMDPELFDMMMNCGEFSQLCFSYRWFLLDFKRELSYFQVFRVWEVFWAAAHFITPRFQLFFALALLTQYRHIIIENRMDFTDVIKFFNEMAEHHNAEELLESARLLLSQLQVLVHDLRKPSGEICARQTVISEKNETNKMS
ncbi:hypothetical protein AB6A40_002569 [Gnathostoma spinigerum]|uniref:Small G protein signaling modulator 1 n=1 Tax=Gnathostoma spinigerum TaxID=75299 RepID=A0ABD6E6Y2_9BILA